MEITPVKEAEVEIEMRPLTPQEELHSLEEEALKLRMSLEELAKIRAIGPCPTQVKARIAMLRRWIASH